MPILGFADSGTAGDPHPFQPEPDDGGVREEINAALVNVLPWGVSAVFHAGLVLLALFVVWSTIAAVSDEDVIIPTVRLGPTPGPPLQIKQTERVERSRQTRRTVTPSHAPTTRPSEMTVEVPKLIGAVGTSSAQAVNFGSAVDVGSQFKASFFGSGGNARKIVFLVDATGSLIDTFPHVVNELKRTIQQLSERQTFTVIFFTGEGPVEVQPTGLKAGNAQLKSRAIEWIDNWNDHFEISGTANPVDALRRGLAYRPELVFLLSDNITGRGQYEINQADLLTEIERANTSHTKINTIQFIYRDPLEASGAKGTMELIADRSGGQYKFVDAQELNIR